MPSDVTGSSIWNQRDADFEFRPGPIFTNLLLADEINRAPPKTQAALLEAMQERQATIEGVTHRFDPPFLVIATQNPIEYEGTYPLPEAQLDRFLLRTAFGYPSREGEVNVLSRRIERGSDDVELVPVIDRETLLAMQAAVEGVHVAESVREYCVDLVIGDPRLAERRRRREPARQSGSAQALPLSGRAARPRLRASRRRQGHRCPRARASARAPPRAVGPADHRRGRRARRPRAASRPLARRTSSRSRAREASRQRAPARLRRARGDRHGRLPRASASRARDHRRSVCASARRRDARRRPGRRGRARARRRTDARGERDRGGRDRPRRAVRGSRRAHARASSRHGGGRRGRNA